jgi:hypothetical protein
MQKRILLIASVVSISILFIACAYYVAIFLPQKQKAGMDIVKLELEAKIEQEKTEQAKIEQTKQQLEQDQQAKLAEDATKQTEEKAKQQKASSASLSSCLAGADATYKKKLDQLVALADDNGERVNATSISILESKRSQTRNECYK